MDENSEKSWSMQDVDRLLSRTEKPAKNQEETVVENFARTMRLADTVTVPVAQAEKNIRVETMNNEEEEKKISEALSKERGSTRDFPNVNTGDVSISSKTAKQRVADIVNGLKKGKTGRIKKVKPTPISFDEALLPKKEHSMETDDNRRRFLERVELKEDEDAPGETKVIERPGFVVKRNKAVNEDGDLEGVPRFVEAQDAKNEEDLYFDQPEEKPEDNNWDDGQIRFMGFDAPEEAPVEISEAEAEKKLQKKRREKIDKFKLMGVAEAEEKQNASDKEIAKLFSNEEPSKKEKKKVANSNALGFEYTDFKDANRIRGTLHKIKRFSALKLFIYVLITVLLFVLNIISSAVNKFDTTSFQVVALALVALCTVIGLNCINEGVAAILKKEPNMKSAVTLAAFAAVVQNICVITAGAVLNYRSFVVSGCAAAAFTLYEFGEYLRHARTYDAFNFCTGKQKDALYSVQEIENKDEKFEIGRTLLMDSPDIRYSCRAKFPSRLIEKCESEVSSDKLQSLLLPIAGVGALVCGIAGGLITKDFLYGVTCATGAMCACVPAFGLAAIQLPLRWANKRLNKAGGLITGQAAVEEYSKANSIVIDSAELFDPKGCRMHGFKDYKSVRIDDIMLFAAAMVVRSGGPLTEAFDQVVSKRDLLPEVHSFNYEDRMGISGWINDQKVIMGNRNMMRHHNFEIDEQDELKYTHDGRKVIYISIANQLAAMLVVSYAPNKKLIPFIRRLGTDGVTILLRNNDSNITTDMINETFGVRFNNIRLISNTSGRLYKKYRTRVREYAKSGIIHDGAVFSFMRSFTMSYTLCGTFKVENLIQLINVIAGIVIVLALGLLKVFTVTGMWPLMLFQAIMTAVAVIVARLRGIF